MSVIVFVVAAAARRAMGFEVTDALEGLLDPLLEGLFDPLLEGLLEGLLDRLPDEWVLD